MVEQAAIEYHPKMQYQSDKVISSVLIDYAAHPRANDKTHVSYYKKKGQEGREARKSRWETKDET